MFYGRYPTCTHIHPDLDGGRFCYSLYVLITLTKTNAFLSLLPGPLRSGGFHYQTRCKRGHIFHHCKGKGKICVKEFNTTNKVHIKPLICTSKQMNDFCSCLLASVFIFRNFFQLSYRWKLPKRTPKQVLSKSLGIYKGETSSAREHYKGKIRSLTVGFKLFIEKIIYQDGWQCYGNETVIYLIPLCM